MPQTKHKIFLVKKSVFGATHSHAGALNEGAHGHDFVYEVKLYGTTNDEGFLADFRKVESDMMTLVNKELAYKNLNAVLQMPPTTENVAAWIYGKMKTVYGATLRSVTVYETPESYIIYEGEDA
ncbi:MAG: 6-carboxytetrahydropterin synthase [Elusimicrobium sp.]|jgi:6-pyruvoyltetrahydropterin/6-carboxytetrahydropterin synthase|nr:6-carboxytetrahydropterin synthase [Elusimicrobium sp.]